MPYKKNELLIKETAEFVPVIQIAVFHFAPETMGFAVRLEKTNPQFASIFGTECTAVVILTNGSSCAPELSLVKVLNAQLLKYASPERTRHD